MKDLAYTFVNHLNDLLDKDPALAHRTRESFGTTRNQRLARDSPCVFDSRDGRNWDLTPLGFINGLLGGTLYIAAVEDTKTNKVLRFQVLTPEQVAEKNQ